MIDPRHQQHDIGGSGSEQLVERRCHSRFTPKPRRPGQFEGVEVAARQVDGQQPCPVGRFPPELTRLRLYPPIDDGAGEPNSGQDLGQLARMTEGVREVADRRPVASRRADLTLANQQIPNQALTGGMNSSGRVYHGPSPILPACTSLRSLSRQPGRASR